MSLACTNTWKELTSAKPRRFDPVGEPVSLEAAV
jgi:hypothetical protein